MSEVLVSDLITRALREIGDANARRTGRDEMLEYFNAIQEKVATETQCLETDAYFDLSGGEPRYAYPEDAVQMSGLRISRTTTPTSIGDYYPLKEIFRDEMRRATYAGRPGGMVTHYIARPEWFELLGTPEADLADGGLITYWRVPVIVVAETTAATMELPRFLARHVQEGMQILARMSGRDRVAARDDYERWLESLEQLRDKIKDRSDDRRSAIRPPGDGDWTQGMR